MPVAHTYTDWRSKLADYGMRCAYCGIHKRETPEKRLFRDHVNPVTRGGTDHIENIVPACWTCNGRKGSGRPGERAIDGASIPKPRIRKRHRTW